jgi:hypothetical protein
VAEKSGRCLPSLAHAVAVFAGSRLGAGCCAVATAYGAIFHVFDGDFFLDAEDRFQEIQFQVIAQVIASLWLIALAGLTAHAAAAEEVFEYVAKIAKRAEVEVGIETAAAAAFQPFSAITIVGGPLLLVGQDLISSDQFLKPSFITRILIIGVQLSGFLLESLLYLICCRCALNAQHFVKVTVCHGCH